MESKSVKNYIIEVIVVFIGILLAFGMENFRISLEEDEESSSYDEEEMREFCLRAGGPMAMAKLANGGGMVR